MDRNLGESADVQHLGQSGNRQNRGDTQDTSTSGDMFRLNKKHCKGFVTVCNFVSSNLQSVESQPIIIRTMGTKEKLIVEGQLGPLESKSPIGFAPK